MSIPTATDLAQMRAEASLLMPDTVTITDPGTPTVTDSGGTTISGATTTTTIGRLNRTGTQAAYREFGEQLTADADWILTLPHDTTIRAGWTVTVGARTLTVQAVAQPGSWGTAVRAAVVESETVGG